MKLSKQIDAFWSWFSENVGIIMGAVAFDNHPKTNSVVQNLDQHILGMGTIKWELGNPANGQFTFTLSPNNKQELLEITKSIIAEAPSIEGWTFYHAAQSTGNYQLEIYDAEMDIQQVDAKNWKVALLPEADGRYELAVEAPNIMYLDEDTQFIAVDLTITALIGEELKINTIAGLDITDSIDGNDSFPIQNLNFELNQG